MRYDGVQMSLFEVYRDTLEVLESDKPQLFKLLDEHLDWDEIIPFSFYKAFYKRYGRTRRYSLDSFLKALFLQRIFHYVEDAQLLNTLRFSYEMRRYCGFDKVPDASKITRFKQDFCTHIRDVFEHLVTLTEPVCRKMDKILADMIVFDTTGIESYVAENNPKFTEGKLRQAKAYGKAQSKYSSSGKPSQGFDPHLFRNTLMPKFAASNPYVKYQYINGHFCYAQKAVIVANGMGIVRHMELLDDDFKKSHPELDITKRKGNPELDKELGDSVTLKPVLRDFRSKHPTFTYSTFSADAAFDSYDNYTFLLGEQGFSKAVIPINPRNSSAAKSADFNDQGIPLCPKDKAPFLFHSKSGGKNRSVRFKFVCPKSKKVYSQPNSTTWRSECANPCTSAIYARCVYVYPNKNHRLYPGLLRGSDEFAKIYNHRVSVERSIGAFKQTLGIAGRKTRNTATTKADLFLVGIVQLLCVLLADKLHNQSLAKSPRKLIAA